MLPQNFVTPTYYLFLVLFFGYPVWASPEFCEKLNTVVQWRVAFFPTIAAGITLTLIPAIRRGRTLCENNGTPWKWPLYPWCLFGFLGLAVCFRSWSLSISLDTGLIRTSIRAMDSAFGLYLLVPFFLAILFVLLEIALVEKSTKLRRFVLWAAPFVLLVSIPRFWPMSHHGTFQQFLATFVMEVGSPILLAILGLLAFYGIAWLRGIRSAENGFVAMCMAAVFVGPRSTGQPADLVAGGDGVSDADSRPREKELVVFLPRWLIAGNCVWAPPPRDDAGSLAGHHDIPLDSRHRASLWRSLQRRFREEAASPGRGRAAARVLFLTEYGDSFSARV